jgi:hypothetical protein
MRAILTCSILALVLAAQAAPPHHWVDISGETRQLADDELNRLMREGDKGSGHAASEFKSARLDDPFYYYTCDANLGEFAADSSSDLMPYLAWRAVMFPIVSGSEALGVAMVRWSGNNPACYFVPVPAGIYDRFKDAVRRVRLDRDQQLSVLSTGAELDFFLVEDGTTIYRMAPASTRTLLTLGLNNQHVEDMRFLPAKEMAPLIKRVLGGQ